MMTMMMMRRRSLEASSCFLRALLPCSLHIEVCTWTSDAAPHHYSPLCAFACGCPFGLPQTLGLPRLGLGLDWLCQTGVTLAAALILPTGGGAWKLHLGTIMDSPLGRSFRAASLAFPRAATGCCPLVPDALTINCGQAAWPHWRLHVSPPGWCCSSVLGLLEQHLEHVKRCCGVWN